MMKSTCDLIVEARWVLPIAPENRVLAAAGVAVSNGRILAIGPVAALNAGFDPVERLRLPDHALLPGLVNAHGHAAMTLLRGFAEDAPLESWLNDHIWPLERRFVSERFVHDGTTLAIAEMIRSGTTCFSDMYFFPETVASLAREIGIRCQVTFPIIDFANAWSASADAALHQGMALHDRYRHDDLIRVAFGPHAPYSVSRAHLEKILMYSEELEANVQIHLHETAAEVAQARQQMGASWVEVLHETGLLSPRLQAVHCTHLSADEIGLLGQYGVQLVHCPHSNLKLVSGICPTTQLLAAGVNVALGTDGAASNNSLDLLQEARLASLLAKLASGDARTLPESKALEMATLGGARALGLEADTGSLEPGKLADMIAVDLSAPRFLPVYDPMAQLVHTGAGSAVTHVWVAGQALLMDGQFTSLDEDAMRAGVRHWHEQISA